jgi:hypothetical protein
MLENEQLSTFRLLLLLIVKDYSTIDVGCLLWILSSEELFEVLQ